jgi:hypothetical protein
MLALKILYTVILGFNKLGYDEHPQLMQTNWFFQSQIYHIYNITTITDPVITNSGFNEQICRV